MDLLLDTADLEQYFTCASILTIKGVTTNPTIISRTFSSDQDPYESLLKLNEILKSKGQELHVQTLSESKAEIIDEAHKLIRLFGKGVNVKIPVTSEGLKAIKALSESGIKVTATAIYSFSQALFAHYNGAKNLALYCNRMATLGIDYVQVIKDIKTSARGARILAASFKSFSQVKDAIVAGADAVTVDPLLLLSQMDQAQVINDVKTFASAWNEKFGKK